LGTAKKIATSMSFNAGGGDLFWGVLSQFCVEINKKWFVAEKGAKGGGQANGSPYVYILYDIFDKDTADIIITYLEEMGIVFGRTLFEQDILASRQLHFESLKRADVFLLISYLSNPSWINMKVLDIYKSPGLGRTKPIENIVLLSSQRIENDIYSDSLKQLIIPLEELSGAKELLVQQILNS